MVVAMVGKGGQVVAEAKAVQPEMQDGVVNHLRDMKILVNG